MSREPIVSLNMYPQSQWVTELGQAWVDWMAGLLNHNKLPLSGDVSQWISAWGEAVGQIGLFNINTVNSANPRLERDIGINYSYGRQLGRMLDVLTPMVATYANTPEGKQLDQKKLGEFEAMVADIQKLKDAKTPSQEDIVRDVSRLTDKLTDAERERFREELIKALSATPRLA